MAQLSADLALDCRGLACPVPILKLSKAITQIQAGQIIELTATDSGSRDDVPAFCQRTGNALVSTREEGGAFVFYVRKGP
ncbi:MAG: sulfurtransferase TusA family protein [Candidatus Rokubacteria bacterium]|nr:sulfurtransferase TusA family protein [Candidatus Rokubacteria bacterium]